MKAVKETERKYYKYQEKYRTFVQPVLTSNGILGGDSFAVDSNTLFDSSCPAWNAFDGTRTVWWGNSSDTINYYIIYNPNPLNIKNINIKNYNGDGASLSGYWYSSSGSVYGSNDGVEWVIIKQYSNDISAYNATWDISLEENTNYYKYYKIDSTSYHPFGSEGWSIQEIILTADENARILIESDESDYDFYKDFDTYKLPREVVRKYYKYITTEYNRPNLTEDGQLGGDSPACLASGIQSGYPAFQAFDGVDTTSWVSYNGYSTPYIIFYDPNGVEVKSIDIYVQMDANRIATCDILGSNDNETYYLLGSAENSSQVPFTLHIDTSDNTTSYKYIKLQVNSIIASPYAYCSVAELRINGNCITSVETTKDDYDFYEDKEVYYGIGD